MKTRVLGIGNPIVTDDGAGLKIAREIKHLKPELDVVEACAGAMGLFDYVVDCDRVVIIDSIKTNEDLPGTLYKLQLEDLKPTLNHPLSHSLDIASALKLGEGLGYKMPQSISLYAVEIDNNTNFGESCTERVAARIPAIAREIIEEEEL